MKKLISGLLALSMLAAPIAADARPSRWHGGGPVWVAPLIIGGIVGGVIVESTRQPAPPPPTAYYPTYHVVVVARYYDRYRGSCEVRDAYDQYNNFVNRQTVCYGE